MPTVKELLDHASMMQVQAQNMTREDGETPGQMATRRGLVIHQMELVRHKAALIIALEVLRAGGAQDPDLPIREAFVRAGVPEPEREPAYRDARELLGLG